MTGPVYLTCPMPIGRPDTRDSETCGTQLHIYWESSMPMSIDDVEPIVDGLPHAGAWASTWRVECESGHVILTPVDLSELSDPEYGGPADQDTDDAFRTYRQWDSGRLRKILAALTPKEAS